MYITRTAHIRSYLAPLHSEELMKYSVAATNWDTERSRPPSAFNLLFSEFSSPISISVCDKYLSTLPARLATQGCSKLPSPRASGHSASQPGPRTGKIARRALSCVPMASEKDISCRLALCVQSKTTASPAHHTILHSPPPPSPHPLSSQTLA